MSDITSRRRRQSPKTDNLVGRRIGEALGDRGLTWLSQRTAVPVSTISDYVKRGISSTENAIKIADALSVSVDWLLTGNEPDSFLKIDLNAPGDEFAVSGLSPTFTIVIPEYDVEVAAGYGAFNFDDHQPLRKWRFPTDWIIKNVGDEPNLRLVTVVGDSQEPELRDGDLVMINLNLKRARPGEGLHVVRLDEALMIKRIQIEGRTLRLVSNNKAYRDVEIDLEADADRFEIIGKAVWAGKLL